MDIDTRDESLLRWHFTNIAELYGATRREAELMFRDNFDYINRKLKGHTDRETVMTKLHKLVEKIGLFDERREE